ncbi:tRNA 2-thiocytidine(32) synthetase TtcA [Myxococcota bacterium]|nr:tRNA 2-thiocytidine(32) synthetase TtcA [Myxococcota bacterium]
MAKEIARPPKLEKKLLQKVGWLNRRYNLIRPGDKILLGVSGGKDSLTLALLLHRLRARVPFDFTLDTITLDQGIPPEDVRRIESWMVARGIPWRLMPTNIQETCEAVVPEGKSPCSACARFRRGILYDVAHQEQAVLALGHHADDAVETLLMNIFFTGKLQSMPPVLLADDGRNRLIRPMLYLRERDIAQYAELCEAPIVGPCSCPGARWISSSQRKKMKDLVRLMEGEFPETGQHLLSATGNIKVSNLMDHNLFDFSSLRCSWEKELSPELPWKEGVSCRGSRQLGGGHGTCEE